MLEKRSNFVKEQGTDLSQFSLESKTEEYDILEKQQDPGVHGNMSRGCNLKIKSPSLQVSTNCRIGSRGFITTLEDQE
jgi:hypothetical protein